MDVIEYVCARVCVCACACVYAYASVRVRMCVHACVCACNVGILASQYERVIVVSQ